MTKVVTSKERDKNKTNTCMKKKAMGSVFVFYVSVINSQAI